MKNKDLLVVLNKYKETDMRVMKENLKNACKNLYEQHGGRQGIAKLIDMELNAFQSCLNPSHSANLTFENLIKFCGILNLNIDSMFKDTDIIRSNRGVSKTWTLERKQSLISLFEDGGIKSVQKKFKLSNKTISHYYNLFTRELNG